MQEEKVNSSSTGFGAEEASPEYFERTYYMRWNYLF